MRRVFLQPGEYFVGKDSARIHTVLGSCVAVVIYDTRLKIGAMNHIVLPNRNGRGGDFEESYFAEGAIYAILKGLKNLGSRPHDLSVKMIGGAAFDAKAVVQVGLENVAEAKKILHRFGLNLDACRVGGKQGYRVQFHTDTGYLRFQLIESQNIDRKIRILIVDDSKMARETIKHAVKDDPRIEVCGEAEDPIFALEVLKEQEVDVLTLDINMPRMDGIRFLREYQRSMNLGIVIVNDYSSINVDTVFQALEAGAVEHIRKPELTKISEFRQELISKIHAAHLTKRRIPSVQGGLKPEIERLGISIGRLQLQEKLILIGASTGGTEAISHILSRLPSGMPPILVVIHMPPVFSRAFAERLNRSCQLKVKEAENGDLIEPDCVFVAPGDLHMEIESRGGLLHIVTNSRDSVNGFRPSVDVLFDSACKIRGKNMLAILLTGMGRDGASGLKNLLNKGMMTIAQDEESSVVFGMPREAIERGAARKILALDEMARFICNWLVSNRTRKTLTDQNQKAAKVS